MACTSISGEWGRGMREGYGLQALVGRVTLRAECVAFNGLVVVNVDEQLDIRRVVDLDFADLVQQDSHQVETAVSAGRDVVQI